MSKRKDRETKPWAGNNVMVLEARVSELETENTSLRERAETAERWAASLDKLVSERVTEVLELSEQLASLRSLNESAGEVIKAGDALSVAEVDYRSTHDLKGDGHIETGRAWDRLEDAGYTFRRLAASWSEKHAATRYDRDQSARTE